MNNHHSRICALNIAHIAKIALVAALLSACTRPLLADPTLAPVSEPSPNGEAAPATPAAPEIAAELRSPRSVLQTFIQRMRADKKKSAAKLLDLSGLSAITVESVGSDLAYKLYQIMPALGRPPLETDKGDAPPPFDPALWASGGQEVDFDYSNVPEDPDHAEPWSLNQWLIAPEDTAKTVTIVRGDDKAWRFSADTVANIDSLYEQSEAKIDAHVKKTGAAKASDNGAEADQAGEPTETLSVWLRKQFPPLLRRTFFILPTYQWLLLLALVPIGRGAELLVRWGLTWLSDRVLCWIDPDFEKSGETTARVWGPVGRLAMASIWVLGATYAIDLPANITNVLLGVLVFVAVIAAVLALFGVIDLIADYFTRRAKRRNRRFDDLLVPLLASTLKIVAAVAGGIVIIANYSDELPAALLGGLGIGGIALALASQETLSNFIGSITLLFDRPFEVGDWVKIDTIEGEVESLGFRSTRIRTGPNSQVTLPNNKLAGASVDNLGRRKYRRYMNKLGLEYGTSPERIEAFCEGIREIVRRHPHTRKDFYAAYFNDFGPSSLDILVVIYFEVPDWATELRERHRMLLDIVRLAESIGVSFAFPTQTLHLQRGGTSPPPVEPIDPELAGAQAGADIAGELPNYQDRPGRVKFPGPTPIDQNKAT